MCPFYFRKGILIPLNSWIMTLFRAEALTDENPDIPLRCAWLNNHVSIMGLLADVSEVSMEIRSSSTWQLVEKEQDKRWQREVLEKLNKQAELLTLVAKAVGVTVEDEQ